MQRTILGSFLKLPAGMRWPCGLNTACGTCLHPAWYLLEFSGLPWKQMYLAILPGFALPAPMMVTVCWLSCMSTSTDTDLFLLWYVKDCSPHRFLVRSTACCLSQPWQAKILTHPVHTKISLQLHCSLPTSPGCVSSMGTRSEAKCPRQLPGSALEES